MFEDIVTKQNRKVVDALDLELKKAFKNIGLDNKNILKYKDDLICENTLQKSLYKYKNIELVKVEHIIDYKTYSFRTDITNLTECL
jgi:hypothetical protein